MGRFYIGIDVGGTKIAYGLFDERNHLIGKMKSPTDQSLSPEEMLKSMCSDIGELLKRYEVKQTELKGVGAAFPSHIDFDEGRIITTSNLPTWNDVPVKELMSDMLQTEVLIDNDANVAAIAEHRCGAGNGKKNMLYITVSTGIGGGIIVNNQIFRGDCGAAGEFGHTIISESGYLCGCGNRGCVQSLASGPKIVMYAQQRVKEGARTLITELAGGDAEKISCKNIEDAAKAGDALAVEIIERTGRYLGILFANLYQIFNIRHYVIGGGVSKFGKPLFESFGRTFSELSKMSEKYPPTIVPAELSDDVGIIGSALLVNDIIN